MQKVIIISSGANLTSIQYAISRLGYHPKISNDPTEIQTADKIILPGVGHALEAMRFLQEHNLVQVLQQATQPVLGICLGMQLLFDFSEEGEVDCLGIIPGRITQLQAQPNIAVPHMGWNQIQWHNTVQAWQCRILIPTYCYFVHSFAAPVTEHTIATCTHGQTFAAMVQKDNFYGVQFHPEKSSIIGSQILKHFLRLNDVDLSRY